MNVRLMTTLSLLAMASALGGCAAVEMGGRAVSWTGEKMNEYAESGKAGAGVAKWGGKLHTDIGNGIQEAAGKKPAVPPPAGAANAPAGK